MVRVLVAKYGTGMPSTNPNLQFRPTTAGMHSNDFSIGTVVYAGAGHKQDALRVTYGRQGISVHRDVVTVTSTGTVHETFRLSVNVDGSTELNTHRSVLRGVFNDTHGRGVKPLPTQSFVAKGSSYQAEIAKLAANPAFAGLIIGAQ